MLNYHVKIGLVPIRRDCTPRPGIFNWEYAEDRARKTVAYIEEHFTSENVSFVDLKSINEVEVLYNEKDVQPVVDLMRKERADAIFIINSNFGNEEVAAMVTKELGLPVLLWGPLDDVFEPDGSRHTDSQCGLFGVSRQMQRYGVPFSYIENCRVNDPIFADGLDKFVRVACMIKNFRGMRIAQVGLRPKPFCSVIFNEGELMQRFGMHIIPVNMAVIIDKYNRILKERDAELEEGAKILFERYQMDKDTPPLAKKIYAFVLLYKEIFEEYDVDVISSECWTSMQLGVGAMPCTAYSILADMGYIVSCESDMHARSLWRCCPARRWARTRRSSVSSPSATPRTRTSSCCGTVVRLPTRSKSLAPSRARRTSASGSRSRTANSPSAASIRTTATISCSTARWRAPTARIPSAPTSGHGSTT